MSMKPSSREAEYAYRRVWEINEMLQPKPSDFVSAARFFVREGELYIWDTKQSKKILYTVFLFNDIMLITTRKKKKFRLRVFVTLRTPSVSVETVDSSGHNFEFRVHCKTKSFYMYCDSADDRKRWIKDIEATIKGTHQEEINTRKIHQDAHEYTIKEMKESYSVGDSSSDDDSDEKPVQRSNSKIASNPGRKTSHGSNSGQKRYADPTATNPFASTQATSPFQSKPGTQPGSKLTTSGGGEKKTKNQSQQQQPQGGPTIFDQILNNSIPFTPTVSANNANNNFQFSSTQTTVQPSPFMTTTTTPFGQTASPFAPQTTTSFQAQQFGQPQPSPFATTTTATPFATNNAFAQPQTTSPFLAPTAAPLFPTTTVTVQPTFQTTTAPFGTTVSSNPFTTNVTAQPTFATTQASNPFATNINATATFSPTPSPNPFATNVSTQPAANPFF